ncbi:hypothetical protein K7X08_014426 [Anisodus acutangulus]|uniref:ARM repeat N-terminal plant domain-containing protein n=1 Tax=Anisodus acutangulus TaxID=402998 RepID=A0A9Q1LI86_9SOLA|nr:hypothetical protein K7X08_014426 [Anisodus acutangulus]
MNNVKFAMKALDCGVLIPLLEILKGNMTWVEQRVAIRAIGHLASYEKTSKDVAIYEKEIVKLAMKLASTCLEVVYKEFVGVKDLNMRLIYHCDMLTRGVRGLEMENRKAEEWASQLQCWSLHLLNCFAIKERTLGDKSNVGNTITRTLLDDFKERKVKIKNIGVQQVHEEIWGLKVDRKKREKNMSDEILEEKSVMVSLMKQQGNNNFWLGKIEEAMMNI